MPNYTVSIVVALPLAFAVTFAADVLMEHLVIRHLYHCPLKTLPATFGISIALQQLAKHIFGRQARQLTSPDWLGLVVRAVTQNPSMVASMGISPDRINMFTFGLGSGIAGIADLVIGLYAKVTSEMAPDYIVQSFMTVVVGGVAMSGAL